MVKYKLGVVIPSWKYWRNPTKLQPLWELYYATLIRNNFSNFDVKIIDQRLNSNTSDIEPIEEMDVYLYWLMKAADAPEVFKISEEIRTAYPNSIQIAGGTHVDFSPLECAPHFSLILNGTAEEQIIAALNDFINTGKINNSYNEIKSKEFNSYSYAERDFLVPNLVANYDHFEKYGKVLGTGVYFSRGCNFKCKFCVYNNPSKFQFRTGREIQNEISYLKNKYAIKGVNLRDEVCLPPNKKVAYDYLNGIGESNIIWRGQSVPFADEDIVALAANSGLQELALGIESADSDLVLEISNKPSRSISNNIKFIELLKKYNIKVKVCLIFGLPGESRNVVEKTIKFLEDVAPDYVALSAFDPIPGSPFYTEPKKFGIKLIDSDLTKHSHLVYRFDDEEEVGLPFEYEEVTPWGKSFTRNEILDNIKVLQKWIRERGMSY
jgi:radical SAM superfamily enzyme YgiQ (UPF0313 family)